MILDNCPAWRIVGAAVLAVVATGCASTKEEPGTAAAAAEEAPPSTHQHQAGEEGRQPSRVIETASVLLDFTNPITVTITVKQADSSGPEATAWFFTLWGIDADGNFVQGVLSRAGVRSFDVGDTWELSRKQGWKPSPDVKEWRALLMTGDFEGGHHVLNYKTSGRDSEKVEMTPEPEPEEDK